MITSIYVVCEIEQGIPTDRETMVRAFRSREKAEEYANSLPVVEHRLGATYHEVLELEFEE